MVIRTEQINIKQSESVSHYAHLSKNLWNEANYAIRQNFFETGKRIRYNQLAGAFKSSENYQELYAQSAQHTLKVLDRSWTAYFGAAKQYKLHPEMFLGEPRIPHYKPKDGEFMLIFTNQQCKIKENYLLFPKKFNLKIKTRLEDDADLREVRIIPQGNNYVVEIIYNKTITQEYNLNKNNVIGIDFGLTNIATIVNNIGLQPIVIKGGALKSMNQFYNKKKSKLQSIYDKQGIKHGTRMSNLTLKRNRKMKDAMHKISRLIVNYCVENDIGTIIIGHNDHWKQKINIGHKNNQNFVSIPHYLLTNDIEYKSEDYGIGVKLQNESHTSKCSFVDNEPVEHREEYVGKRIKRGLFRTRLNYIINADVNAGLNIIRKSTPEALNHMQDITGRDIGAGLVPFKCNYEQYLSLNKGVCY